MLIAMTIGSRAGATSDAIDEIVITARKIAEPLAEVPLSIQVLDREQLERSGIDGLQSLAGHVPGLYVEPMWGGTNAAPTLRGQSHPGPGGNTVGVFVDGVLQANVSGDDAAMFDLERVEVVKGPQSALYGSSTFAGAINFVTRRPTTDVQREVGVSIGNDSYYALFASLSGPLGPEGLLGRASVATREFDGTAANAADSSDNLGGYRKLGIALSMEYSLLSAWRLVGDLRLMNDRSEQPAASTVFAAGYNCGSQEPGTGYWSFYCGDLPRTSRFDLSPDVPDSNTRTVQASLRAEWTAGQLSANLLSAYYRSHSSAYRDWDGTSVGELMGVCTIGENCDAPSGQTATVNRLVNVNQVEVETDLIQQFTQELRLRYRHRAFDYLLGVQVVASSDHSGDGVGIDPLSLAGDERLTVLLPASPQRVGPMSALNLSLTDDQRLKYTRTDMFGAIDYHFGQRVDLHAEFRQGLGAYGVATPRVSVDYRTGTSGLMWLSFARGGTAGGSNGNSTLIPSERHYGAESEWTYEMGFRGALLQEHVNLSATAFYNDWRNAQIPGPSNTPGYNDAIIRNVNGIRTPGVEFTIEVKIARILSMAAGYTYDDPRFKSGSEDYGGTRFCGVTAANTTSNFCTLGPSRVVTQGPALIVPYVDGNALQRAPEHQWNASLTLEPPGTAAGWHKFLQLSAAYQGRVYVRPIDGAYDGERTLLDARLGISRGPWSLEAWGSNLTDANYISAVASRGRVYFPVVVQPQDLIYGVGRRFGVDVRCHF
jgi:iron complex outermembrane receptor protein